MTGPIVRILLRYLSGFLIARGMITEEGSWLFSDPDFVSTLEMVVGVLITMATEYAYFLAQKFGWAK